MIRNAFTQIMTHQHAVTRGNFSGPEGCISGAASSLLDETHSDQIKYLECSCLWPFVHMRIDSLKNAIGEIKDTLTSGPG